MLSGNSTTLTKQVFSDNILPSNDGRKIQASPCLSHRDTPNYVFGKQRLATKTKICWPRAVDIKNLASGSLKYSVQWRLSIWSPRSICLNFLSKFYRQAMNIVHTFSFQILTTSIFDFDKDLRPKYQYVIHFWLLVFGYTYEDKISNKNDTTSLYIYGFCMQGSLAPISLETEVILSSVHLCVSVTPCLRPHSHRMCDCRNSLLIYCFISMSPSTIG